MADTLEITGKNTISFAEGQRWQLTADSRPRGMSNPLTRSQILSELPRLPREIRGHALEMGLSKIVFTLDINGGSGTDMEDALHDLVETLEDGLVYIGTKGARGTEAQVKYQKAGASATSYKTLFYGLYDEAGARQVLGPEQMSHKLRAAALTLYCEPYWHPSAGTSITTPDYLYNHDDSDAGHDNFFDISAANIKGDVPAKTRIRLADDNVDEIKWVYAARRSEGTVANFDHWMEAENAGAGMNWTSTTDADRSGGYICTDASNTGGFLRWTITTNLNDYKGRFGIYAAFKTDDITNTRVRGRYLQGQHDGWAYGKWQRLGRVNRWQLIYLLDAVFDGSLYPPGATLAQWEIYIEYEKDGGGDYVSIDYVMLLPEDESVLQLEAGQKFKVGELDFDSIEANGIADFPGAYVTKYSTGDFYAPASLRGDYLTLQPGCDNRIYVKVLRAQTDEDTFDLHTDLIDNDGSPASRFVFDMWYLPQYISPLE